MGPAERDYNRALAMARSLKSTSPKEAAEAARREADREAEEALKPDAVAKRFAALRTAPADVDLEGTTTTRASEEKCRTAVRLSNLSPCSP